MKIKKSIIKNKERGDYEQFLLLFNSKEEGELVINTIEQMEKDCKIYSGSGNNITHLAEIIRSRFTDVYAQKNGSPYSSVIYDNEFIDVFYAMLDYSDAFQKAKGVLLSMITSPINKEELSEEN